MLVYTMSRLSKYQGYLWIAYLFYGHFTVALLLQNKLLIFLSLDTQDAERG